MLHKGAFELVLSVVLILYHATAIISSDNISMFGNRIRAVKF